MRFGPGHESLNKKQNGRQSCCFEWLKGHKVGIFVKKVLRKGLKRAGILLSVIRRLQGNTLFRWMELSLRYSIACLGNVLSTTWSPMAINMQGLSVRCKYCNKTKRPRYQIRDTLQVWKCNLQGTVFKCILKLFWSTLQDSAKKSKMKIYCTEMHDLSKNVNLSRVCGSF